MGDCTLYNADCLDVMPSLGKVDAIVTDPPFNVGKYYGDKVNDKLPKEEFYKWMDMVLSHIETLSSGRFAIFGLSTHSRYFSQKDGIKHITYEKPGNGTREGTFLRNCSSIWCGKPAKPTLMLWKNGRCVSNEAGNMCVTLPHPGMTSRDATRRMIHHFSDEGETVLDPFMGTGTTGLYCIKMGRKFIGIEIESKYFDMACEQIENAYKQMDIFVAPPVAATQEAMQL